MPLSGRLSFFINMRTFFKLIRLPNLLIIILVQYLTSFCVIKPLLYATGLSSAFSNNKLFMLVLMTLLVTSGGYIINDLYDQRIDKINKPGLNVFNRFNKVLLLILYALFNIAGIFIGFYLARQTDSMIMGWLILCIVIVLWLYSWRYKRQFLLGNIIVSFLLAFVVVIVWLFEFFFYRSAYGNTVENVETIMTINKIILFYASLAFILSLLREIVKDIEDREGDAEYGCKTLAVLVGVKVSKLVVSILMSAVVLILVYLQYFQFNEGYILLSWYFVFAVQLPLIYLIYLTIKAETIINYKYISSFLKVIMLSGILSMFFIKFI